MEQEYVLKQVSKKPTSCSKCGEQGLRWSWNFHTKRPMLVRIAECPTRYFYLRPHRCPNEETQENDIRPTKCRYCGSTAVFWVKQQNDKFELTEGYGLPHYCEQYKEFRKDYKEALRENYAFEKKWINSFTDGAQCKYCKGHAYKLTKHRNAADQRFRPCKRCKGLGTFTADRKKNYLFNLRKKYWPYKPWMKWGPPP